jgi:hypothetical protein
MMIKTLSGGLLVAALLGVNAARLSGPEGGRALRQQAVWSLALPGVSNALAVPLGPQGRTALATHTMTRLVLLDLDGNPVADQSWSRLAAIASGDVDGDRRDELVALTDSPARVTVLEEGLRPRWSAPADLPWPSRVLVADLDGDGHAEVMVAGGQGVEAFTSTGRALWTYRFPRPATGEAAELRGLDDVRVGHTRRVAVARRDGTLALLAPDGSELLDRTYDGGLRRMRAADLDNDGQGELMLGREDGGFDLLDAGGTSQHTTQLGEAVAELRQVDLDGHDAAMEIVLGGKRGTVQIESPRLGTLRRTSMPAKLTALGATDLDGDGQSDLALGDEQGHVQVETSSGRVLLSLSDVGKVERLLALPEPGLGLRNAGAAPATGRALVVASANGVAVWRLRLEHAPAWYSSWAAGVLGLLGLAVAGLALRGLRPPNTPPAPEVVLSGDVQRARAQIEAWIRAGHLTEAQAAERLRQLARALEPPTAAAPAAPPPPPPRT